jgi:hypothetical protein
MIVCDVCKKIPKGGKNEPFLYEITGSKMEETKVGKKGAAAGREIVKIPMHLCDGCITVVNRNLGRLVSSMQENEPTEFEHDPSKPVGITEREFAHTAEQAQANVANRVRGEDDPSLMANRDFVSPVK